jgi:hypothetical protein
VPTRELTQPGAARVARPLVAALFAALVALPAFAATYYVKPGGADTNNGTSSATAWKTIGKANSTLVAGDVVRIDPGTYTDAIAPANNGSVSARITYMGNLAAPSGVVVPAIDLEGDDYISIKGVQATGDITLSANTSGNAAYGDSVLYVIGLRCLYATGAWYCVVANSQVGTGDATDKFQIGVYPGSETTANASITAFCTFQDNTFRFGSTSGGNAMSFSHMRNNRFIRNRNFMTLGAGATDTHSNTYYRCKDNTFIDCSYTLKNLASYEVYIFNQRDSSRFNSFVRDTFQIDPASTNSGKVEFATSGAFPGTCKYNSWTDCLFKVDGTFGHQSTVKGDRFFGNVMAFENKFEPKGDSLVFRHNTFYGTGTLGWDTQQTDLTNATIRGNVIVTTGSTAGAHNYIPDVSSVRSDSNLVYSTGNDATHAMYIRSTGALSGVGSGTAWCSSYGKDCGSSWANPQFTSTTWTSLDLRPKTGSPAYSATWPNGYVGAFPAEALVGDATPPATTADLAVTIRGENYVVLSWTAPGDDGTAGAATQYDIRMSSSAITAANFASATALAPVPSPSLPGETQSYVVLNLTPGTAYYFALRTADEASNWSGVSNSPTGTTNTVDTTPPAAVTDLGATP